MLVEWIAVIIIAAIGIFLLQIEHHTKKYKVFLIALVGLLLYFSIIGVFSSEEIDFKSPKSIVGGVYLYVGWIGQAASSIWDIGENTVSLVGNAIKVNTTKEERPRS